MFSVFFNIKQQFGSPRHEKKLRHDKAASPQVALLGAAWHATSRFYFNCANCAHLMCWFWFCDFYKQTSTGFAQILVLQNPRTHIIWDAHGTNPTMSNFAKLRVEHFRTRSATLIHSGIMNGSYSKQLCRQLSQMCKIHAPTTDGLFSKDITNHATNLSKSCQKPTKTHQKKNQSHQNLTVAQTHQNPPKHSPKPYQESCQTPTKTHPKN